MKCKRFSCQDEVIKINRGKMPLYCSQNCKNIEAVNTYRRKRKREAVAYKGGKCSICSYDKSYSALQFHHIDATNKEFSISRWTTSKWDRIVKELDKCILICANCHAEQHGEE